MSFVHSLSGNLKCQAGVRAQDLLSVLAPLYAYFRFKPEEVAASVISRDDFRLKSPALLNNRIHVVIDPAGKLPQQVMIATTGPLSDQRLLKVLSDLTQTLTPYCEPGNLRLINLDAKNRGSSAHTVDIPIGRPRPTSEDNYSSARPRQRVA